MSLAFCVAAHGNVFFLPPSTLGFGFGFGFGFVFLFVLDVLSDIASALGVLVYHQSLSRRPLETVEGGGETLTEIAILCSSSFR